MAKAFLAATRVQTKLTADISVLDAENYLKRITESISSFLYEDLKFTREQWDPTLKSDKYLFTKAEPAAYYFAVKCNSLLKELNAVKANLELVKSFNLVGFEFKTPYVEGLIKAVDYKLKSIGRFKAWVVENKKEIKQNIPYICGVWNGLVGFVAGMVDVVLLGVRIVIDELVSSGTNLALLVVRESIEEILVSLLKEPLQVIDAAIAAIQNYKYVRYDDPKLNKYQLQYNEGEDTILAIDLVVSVVTTIKGTVALAKALPKFTKWIDDVLKKKGKGARKALNASIKLRKVTYGESELSKAAIKFRKTLGKAKLHNGNIVILEYVDEVGSVKIKEFTTLTEPEWKILGYKRKPHAEEIMIDWVIDNNIAKDKVSRIFSELEPCNFDDHLCKQQLENLFPDAIKEYSYDYPGKLGDYLKYIRDIAIKERANDLKKLIK